MLNKMLLLLLININIFAASFEVGGIMGRPIALSTSYKFGSNSIDLNLGLISYKDDIEKNGRVTEEETAWGKYIDINYMLLLTPNKKLKVFNFGIGFGGVLFKTQDISFGLKLPMQLLFFIKEANINIFLELAPGMILYEKSGFTLLGGLGARYVFGGESKKQNYKKSKKNNNNNNNNKNNTNNSEVKNVNETKDVKTEEKKDEIKTTDETKTNTKDDSKSNTNKTKNNKNTKNKNTKSTDKTNGKTEETTGFNPLTDKTDEKEDNTKTDDKEVNHEVTKVKIKIDSKDDKKEDKKDEDKKDDKKDDKKKNPKGVEVPW